MGNELNSSGCTLRQKQRGTQISPHLGEDARGEGVHKGAGGDGEVVDEAVLERGEVLLDEVGGAVVAREAGGAAVVVEVVVLAQVRRARRPVERARDVR